MYNGVARTKAVLSVVVAAALTATSVRAGDYIRLIESNPPPPPVAPTASKKVVRLTSAIEILAIAGPLFNEQVVYRQLQKNFDLELKQGIEQATKLGQRGVLLKVQVLTTTTDAGPFYSLRGDGVLFFGVGTNPNDVCIASKCFNSFDEEIPPGASITTDSGYVWVERNADGKTYQSSLYRIDRMEERASQVYFNSELRDSYRAAMTSSAFYGYAEQLVRTVKNRQDRERVLDLIKSRDDAVKRLGKVEAELAKELRKAERAAKTSATLNAIAGAFSLASMLATINASMGEKVTAGGGFGSKEEAIQSMKAIEAQTGQRVQALSIERTTLRNSITGWEGSLLRIDATLVPPAGSVLRPLP